MLANVIVRFINMVAKHDEHRLVLPELYGVPKSGWHQKRSIAAIERTRIVVSAASTVLAIYDLCQRRRRCRLRRRASSACLPWRRRPAPNAAAMPERDLCRDPRHNHFAVRSRVPRQFDETCLMHIIRVERVSALRLGPGPTYQPARIVEQIRATSELFIRVWSGKCRYLSSTASIFGKSSLRPPKMEYRSFR